MNNAALERLASVTERVQSRPAPSALEQKSPGERRGIPLEGDYRC
ncbi:DNA polymerase III subunits gamma and tau [Enterobacter hormaechei]|nr:DNA polymerase III subunits gamma and tau [Enterobacter hormaechei]